MKGWCYFGIDLRASFLNVWSLQLQESGSAETKTGPGIWRKESAGVQETIGGAGTGTAEEAQGAATETPLTNIHRHPAWVKVCIQVLCHSISIYVFIFVFSIDRLGGAARMSM